MNRLQEALANWSDTGAAQILEATAQARDGLITESEMLAKIKDVTGELETVAA